MSQKYDKIEDRLHYLNDYLENLNMDDIQRSIACLFNEAGNNNQEAIMRLSELADNFSNLNISFEKLVDFIDRKFYK